jgi:hypothetical protein
MALSTFPVASSGGGIKSIQRGEALSATSITITSVSTTKTTVKSFGTASSGSVGINTNSGAGLGPVWRQSATWNGGTGFFAGTYGAYLSNATTIVTTGPCRYEIVEFN